MPEWMSILPPLVAIAVAIWKKEVIVALVVGIWLGEGLFLWQSGALDDVSSLLLPLVMMAKGFFALMERIVSVFESAGNVRVLLFGLVVGALLELMQASGGVSAFVNRLTSMGLTKSRRQVGALASVTGMVVFVESSMSVLSAGVVSQRLFDKFGMSRARLAFIIDSTSAPICILVLLNAWGAYIVELMEPFGFESSVGVVMSTIPFNFYALLILVLVWYTALSTKVHGPMKQVDQEQVENGASHVEGTTIDATRSRYMWAPLLTLIAGMFFFMWYTGDGTFANGSGSMSVLVSVTLATILAIVMLVKDKVYSYRDTVDVVYVGMGKLIPVSMVMMLSFAIGASCKALGTGPFVASFLGSFLPALLVAPLVFLCAAIISFTTGTSWGTFAILIPLAIPLGLQLELPPAFVLSAVLGGGVFGDHCSPISDTTILSSLASGCDHLEHVRTQLPYAVTAGVGAMILYIVVGMFL